MSILCTPTLHFVQCASSVDNLAAFYFTNITVGESPSSPAAVNLARHIAASPSLFPEVRTGQRD
jgi:exportin-7